MEIIFEKGEIMFSSLFNLVKGFVKWFRNLVNQNSKKKGHAKSYIQRPNYWSIDHSKGFYMYYYTNKARVQRIKNKRILKGFAG